MAHNKYNILFLFFSLSLFITDNIKTIDNIDIKNNNKLDTFLNNLEEYRPSAPWICGDLISQNADDFFASWKEISKRLTDKANISKYFDENKKYFEVENYWNRILWQCGQYGDFIDNLYVNIKTKQLWYISNGVLNRDEEIAISEYWKYYSDDQDWQDMSDIYAFYADALSNLIINIIIPEAYSNLDLPDFDNYYKMGTILIELSKSILPRLNNTKYESKYDLNAKKYEALFHMLENEYLSRLFKN